MLPFLQSKRLAASIMETRKADGNQKVAPKAEEMSMAKRLIEAVHSKDEKAVASILEELKNAPDEVEEQESV